MMVDKDLRDDCLRAYGYFRWADDVIDVFSKNPGQRISFIKRQRDLVRRLYRKDRPKNIIPEEEIIVDLISNDKDDDSRLQSFIDNFLAILEFDAKRKGQRISQKDLKWYSECLGKSVTDGIQYFVVNGHPYPEADNRYLAATAAHITHMLRDMVSDFEDGFINVPHEYLEANGISPGDILNPAFRAWVQERVDLACEYFGEGKRYLDELDVLRCKLVGYCARFECVLRTIERDNYILRSIYHERRKISTWLSMFWISFGVIIRHITR
jgi:phytoene/squalene synthetase